MPRERRARLCAGSILAVLALWLLLAVWPLVAVALAQEAVPVTVPAVTDPLAAALLAVLQGGGLPAVLALAAWWVRGALASGVPVTVRLSDEDRTLLRRLMDQQE